MSAIGWSKSSTSLTSWFDRIALGSRASAWMYAVRPSREEVSRARAWARTKGSLSQ